jgi:hypothetical protein
LFVWFFFKVKFNKQLVVVTALTYQMLLIHKKRIVMFIYFELHNIIFLAMGTTDLNPNYSLWWIYVAYRPIIYSTTKKYEHLIYIYIYIFVILTVVIYGTQYYIFNWCKRTTTFLKYTKCQRWQTIQQMFGRISKMYANG